MTAAVAAMIFSACSTKDDGGTEVGDNSISITPTMLKMSGTRASETDFDAGDQMGLTIRQSDGKSYVSNMKFIYDEAKGAFYSEEKKLWYEDTNDKSVLFAYYPYVAGENAPVQFTVAADQNAGGYAASDLITAVKADVLPTSRPVDMTFRHRTARIIINIDNQTEFPVTKVVIKGVKGTGTISAENGGLTVVNDAAEVAVTAREVTADVKLYALLIPQSAKLKVEISTDEGVRIQTLGEASLEGGKNHTLNARVLPTNMEVVLEDNITGWEEGEELKPEGEGETDTGLEYGGVKYKTVVMKDGRVWMAENLRYLPEGVTVSTNPADNDAKVWAPYTSDGTTMTPLTDPADIAKIGYLYSFDLAFGAEVTAANSASFEGVRGICPPEWHIPTQAEWIALIGKTNKNAEGVDLTDRNAPYYDAVYDGGRITKLDADKFNFINSGIRMRSTIAGAGSYQKNIYDGHLSLSYLFCSTLNKNIYSSTDATQLTNIQFFAPMTLFNASSADGKLTVGYVGFKSGMTLRCIKDKQ